MFDMRPDARNLARYILSFALLLVAPVAACKREALEHVSADASRLPPPADSGFDDVPDSAWVTVTNLALIGFYPIASNEKLALDADLATALDDFSYHIGAAMDSLLALGVTVHYRGGDTVWLRTGADRWRFTRAPDSADVGYVLADSARRRAIIYGVRTYVDLIAHVHEFQRTGQVRPR